MNWRRKVKISYTANWRGTVMSLGNEKLPQAAFTTSFMQQTLGRQKVSQIIECNKMLNELLKLMITITFRSSNKPPLATVTIF